MRKAIILDYSDGNVIIARIPDSVPTCDIDIYIYDTLGYKESECSYMVSDIGSFAVFEHGADISCCIL